MLSISSIHYVHPIPPYHQAQMSSEVDPLLPKNEPAPEITGHGFSTKKTTSTEVIYDEISRPREDEDDDAQAPPSDASARTAVSSIVSIFTVVVFIAFVLALYGSGGLATQPQPIPKHPESIPARVSRILNETPLIDGHNDLAIFLRVAYQNHIHTSRFRKEFENEGMEQNVDLPRLAKGKVGGSFWSAYVPCPNNASNDFSDSTYSWATSMTLSQIDLVRRLQDYYPSAFTPATASLSTALAAFHSNHTLISPISIEGLHQLPPSSPFSTLRLYRSLGVRAATLTWNCHNKFADAALITDGGRTIVAPPHRGGLTPLGRRMIRELNRLGILVDLSHTSYWTQKAVLTDNTSLAPVIYSHSSAFGLCPHPRNVHDDMLELVRRTGSLVMINFSPAFISCVAAADPPAELPELYPANNTLHQVARHVVYVGEKIGYDHVGLGSDFDGMGPNPPRGLDGVDKFPDLVAELLRLGVSDRDAAKVVGGNLVRVWRAADDVADRMRTQGVLEEEDDIPEIKWAEAGLSKEKKEDDVHRDGQG